MNDDSSSDTAAHAADSPTKPLRDVIAFNEGLIKDHLDKIVVTAVEETLNALLDAEADRLCGAKRYEHSADRVDTRSRHFERSYTPDNVRNIASLFGTGRAGIPPAASGLQKDHARVELPADEIHGSPLGVELGRLRRHDVQ